MLEALLAGGLKAAGMFLDNEARQDSIAAQREMTATNLRNQMEFARHGIKMRVEDAKEAGIHPLYALGASPTSFSPISVGATSPTSFAADLGSMGQDISRAVSAYKGPTERVSAVSKVVEAQELTGNKLKLDNMNLQNQILRARLATLTQPGSPPGVEFPVPEKNKPEERPPLMIFGKRWDTNPNTSPMKAWEDQYGDEGPIAWGMPLVIGANDFLHNAGKMIPSGVSRFFLEAQRKVQEQYMNRYGRR